MRRTSRLVLLAGIFLAALTFIVIILLHGPGGGQTPQPTETAPQELTTVVAQADIPLGTQITAEMLTTRTIKVTDREAGALGDPSQAIGEIAGADIRAGGQVTTRDLLRRDVGLTVPPGRRAVTIAVNELTGVARLVEAGDTVDVVVTFNIEVTNVLPDGTVTEVGDITAHSTKLVLQEIPVIGTMDQALPPPVNEQGQPIGTPSPGFVAEFPAGSKLLILAVTAQQAEVLIFSRAVNTKNDVSTSPASTIDVILRSPVDAGILETTTGVILRTMIEEYGVLPPEVIVVPFPTEAP